MKKKKTIKSKAWTCEVSYSKQKTEDIKQLRLEIKKEENWIELLEEKKSLEEKLFLVKIKIIKRCIVSACQHKSRCANRIKELKELSQKNGKKSKQL